METRHSPTYWRDRADEMRSIAESFENVDTKRVLLDIAADFWDRNRRSDAISILLSAPFTHARKK